MSYPPKSDTQELEKVQSLIKSNLNIDLSLNQVKDIWKHSKNDFDYLQEKIDITKSDKRSNVIGFLIEALKKDYKAYYLTAEQPVKKNKIVNYTGRKWDYKKLAELERQRLINEIEETENEKTKGHSKIEYP